MEKNQKDERTSFVFYRSFFEAAQELDIAEKALLYDAIINYGLFNQQPDKRICDKHIIAMFKLIQPQIDKNYERYENGKKGAEYGKLGAEYGKLGGRPRKTKPQQNPKNPPITPQQNPKNPPNVNVNVNPNENEDFQLTNNTDINSKEYIPAGTVCTSGCNLPAGMTQEEYERRMREARE